MDIGGNYRRLTVVVVDEWFGRESQHVLSRKIFIGFFGMKGFGLGFGFY